MQGTLVLRFKSSAVRTVFLPMAISSVRAKPRSRPVATPLAAERDPRKVFTGTVGTWGSSIMESWVPPMTKEAT